MSTKFTIEQLDRAYETARKYRLVGFGKSRRVTKQVRISTQLAESVKHQAKEQGVTMSKFLDRIIKEALRTGK